MSTFPAPLVLAPEPFTTPTAVTLPHDVVVAQMHHEAVTLADLPGIFDAGFSVLAGLGPVGPGYAVYGGDVSATFDLTIGFPVRGAADGAPADLPDGVVHGIFPRGTAWVTSHVGPFDGLGAAWARLLAEVGPEAGTAGRKVEIYVTDPSRSAAEDLRTDLVLLPD